MSHAPSAGSIAQPVNLQSSVLLLWPIGPQTLNHVSALRCLLDFEILVIHCNIYHRKKSLYICIMFHSRIMFSPVPYNEPECSQHRPLSSACPGTPLYSPRWTSQLQNIYTYNRNIPTAWLHILTAGLCSLTAGLQSRSWITVSQLNYIVSQLDYSLTAGLCSLTAGLQSHSWFNQ